MKKSKGNVLVIGDTHLPFEVPGYLDFCAKVRDEYGCGTIIHIGDLVDNHAISFHDHDPDGSSPIDEMHKVDKKLVNWFKEFPKVSLCRGNHDKLVGRKIKSAGIPSRCLLPFRDIWSLPNKWEDEFEFIYNNVLYKHGMGMSGKYMYRNAAERALMSTVTGHAHSATGVSYIQTSTRQIFGMGVGCGIDNSSYAFLYGLDYPWKPVISCGVVLDRGRFPIVIPKK